MKKNVNKIFAIILSVSIIGMNVSCSVRASVKATGENVSQTPIKMDGYDYSGSAFFARLVSGEIVYAMEKTNNEEAFNRFFYADRISISRPFVVDNPYVLNKLMVTEPITIKGNYNVYQAEELPMKFIIIR
jgi:hypothetical protein